MIADDHEISAQGTQRILWESWPDIVTATSIDATIRRLDSRPVDLLLLDVMFRGELYRSGFTILRHCAARHPTTRIILLTGFDDGMTALAARDQGAHGCVGKHHSPDHLVAAVATVLAGGEAWGDLLQRPTLSRQQLAVLGYCSRGHSQQQIADQLGIALVTVQAHLREARHRLHVGSTAHAVHLATRLGVIIPDAWPEVPRRVIRKQTSILGLSEGGGGGGHLS